MKMKKLMMLLLLSLAVVSPLTAQVKYYKVQNGTKTLLKTGEKFVIPVNEKLEASTNFLMEIDIIAFKKLYTYQSINATMLHKNSEGDATVKDYINWNLGSELFKSKYGTEKVLNYYLFGTEEVRKNPKNMYFYKDKGSFSLTDALDTIYFDIEAAYKTGKEGYFENDAYKERDVFSKREYVPNPNSPIVSFQIPAAVLLDKKYKDFVDPGYASTNDMMGLSAIHRKIENEWSRVKDIKTAVPVVGYIATFPEVARAMESILDQREAEIKKEADKQKAIDLVEQWSNDSKYLIILEKSETPTLKALNKKMKGITDPNALMDLFKGYTGK
jgi:hypothetical protein